jgi:hypothetical protein
MRYLVEASLTVFNVWSALRPPITRAMWYGGQAEVPSVLTCIYIYMHVCIYIYMHVYMYIYVGMYGAKETNKTLANC